MAKHRGFTLPELITVMVVLGILSAVALPRMMDNRAFVSAVFRADVVSALRYAQKSAVGHRRLVCATLTPTMVTLSMVTNNPDTSCAIGAALPSPDGAPYQSKDGSVQASGYPGYPGIGVLYFQPDGRITTNGDGTGVYPSISSIAITWQSTQISIIGATGYVE
jgi:MSHA pilin protein MshC